MINLLIETHIKIPFTSMAESALIATMHIVLAFVGEWMFLNDVNNYFVAILMMTSTLTPTTIIDDFDGDNEDGDDIDIDTEQQY